MSGQGKMTPTGVLNKIPQKGTSIGYPNRAPHLGTLMANFNRVPKKGTSKGTPIGATVRTPSLRLLLPAPQGTLLAGARGGWCATAHAVQDGRRVRPPPPPRRCGDGLAEVGRGFGVHRALWGPEPGPWAGGGGRYLTSGQSFRRTAIPRGGRGEGRDGYRLRQPRTHNPLA